MIGIQMYTVKDKSEKDFEQTIRNVVSIGYKELEFAGYYGLPPDRLKAILEEVGAKGINAHVSLEALKNDFPNQLAYIKAMGMEVVTIPYIADEYRCDEMAIKNTCQLINEISKKLAKENVKLAYHNHGMEFEKINDTYIMDLLLENTDMYLELDTYWSYSANVDTIAYMKKHRDRLLCIHVKDMDKNEEKSTELGNGRIDVKEIINVAKELDVKSIILEQEHFEMDCLEAIKIDYKFLVANI
ncbi:MAG: sugar phosphate isomerase/epimerase family protein [Lachnospirales bacterium]